MSERILIITDDGSFTSRRRMLEERGFAVKVARNADDGYQQLIESQFDLAIVNIERASIGVDLIKRIRSSPSLTRLFVLTIAQWGSGQPTVALAQGTDGFERKPIEDERLIMAVERLLRPNMVMTAKASSATGEFDE